MTSTPSSPPSAPLLLRIPVTPFGPPTAPPSAANSLISPPSSIPQGPPNPRHNTARAAFIALPDSLAQQVPGMRRAEKIAILFSLLRGYLFPVWQHASFGVDGVSPLGKNTTPRCNGRA